MRVGLLAATLLLGAALAAQARTFVVDAANGPGTDFTDLPAALAAANHGDVLRVRAGVYRGFTTGKGVALLGEPGAIVAPASGTYAVTCTAEYVPAYQAFRMRGFEIQHAEYGSSGIVWNGSFGHVYMEDVTVRWVGAGDMPGAAFYAQTTSVVTMTRCRGGSASFSNTRAIVQDCELRGYDENSVRGAWSALYVNNESSVTGGRYVGGSSTRNRPAPALNLFWRLRLAGGAGTVFQAGTGPTSVRGASAVFGQGHVELDPSVQLLPSGGEPGIDMYAGTLTVRPLAHIATTAANLGAPMIVGVFGRPGDRFALAFSLPSDPPRNVPDLILLDLGAYAILTMGVLPGPLLPFGIPIPPDPALRGLPITFQGFVEYAGEGRFGFTNASTVVLGG